MLIVALLVAVTFFVSGCAEKGEVAEDEVMDKNIVETAIADGNFETLVTAVQEAGLAETLSGEGPFTVFAPTDEAFSKLPEGMLNDLLADREKLTAVLTYHVVAGEYMATDVAGLDALETLEGESITIDTMDGVMVNDANVIAADVKASNGVIHAIDKVLIPPSMAEPKMDIVDTAVAAGSFTTLVTAIQTADLEETLRGDGPFTVFAPTDAAFEKLPEGTLAGLIADKDTLTGVLTYHVAAGKLMAKDVAGLDNIETLQGSALPVDTTEGVKVGDAAVIETDIETSNGIIHVIDTVLTTPEYMPFIDPNYFEEVIDNPYFPLTPGTTFVYEGESEGETIRNEIFVTDQTREIMGITTIVVREKEWEDDELIEETFDWYAQDMDGNIWYFGEDSKEYEDGKVVSTQGSWEAGMDGAQPGILIKGDPQIGDVYRQEYLKGEAEDMAEVISLDESVTVKYGSFENCLKTKEWNPLEPGEENKYYAPGVGLLLEMEIKGGDEKLELVDIITD